MKYEYKNYLHPKIRPIVLNMSISFFFHLLSLFFLSSLFLIFLLTLPNKSYLILCDPQYVGF